MNILWLVRRVEVQRAQKAILDATKESKEFDTVKGNIKWNNTTYNTEKKPRPAQKNCWYCDTMHEPCRCREYGKSCAWYGRVNHSKWVCRCQCIKVSKDGYREKCRVVHDTHQETEEEDIAAENCDGVRSVISNFHSIISLTIAKLKTKAVKNWNMWI